MGVQKVGSKAKIAATTKQRTWAAVADIPRWPRLHLPSRPTHNKGILSIVELRAADPAIQQLAASQALAVQACPAGNHGPFAADGSRVADQPLCTHAGWVDARHGMGADDGQVG